MMPDYAENLLPWSVVSRPLAGEIPTIDLVVGYSRSNSSGVLKLFLSRLDELETMSRIERPIVGRQSVANSR